MKLILQFLKYLMNTGFIESLLLYIVTSTTKNIATFFSARRYKLGKQQRALILITGKNVFVAKSTEIPRYL